MKKAKRILAVLVLLTMIVSLFAACQGETTSRRRKKKKNNDSAMQVGSTTLPSGYDPDEDYTYPTNAGTRPDEQWPTGTHATSIPTTKATTTATWRPTTQQPGTNVPVYTQPNDQIGSTLEEEYGATLKILIPGHNPKDSNAWQNQVVNEFKMQYPNVTVQFVTGTWNDWYDKLLAAYQSGDPIDLINDGVNNNPKFPLMGITQPLQNYVNMNNPNLHVVSMDACFKYGGNYYVAASETNFGIIYYNKDMFEEKGLDDPMDLYRAGQWNWTNFTRLAKQLTNKSDGVYGFSTEFPYLFYGSNATSTLKLDAYGHYSLNMDDPAFRNTLEMIQDGTDKSGWSGWDMTAMGTFQNGKSAMLGTFTMYESDVNALNALFGWDLINYGAVPLPYGPNNPQGLNMVHSTGWAIGAGSDCPAHVGKLIDMLVDGHAAYQAEQSEDLPYESIALYQEMYNKQFCVNTRDSAIGGGYELASAVANGQSIPQAIEEFKPQYQAKINNLC